MKCPCCKSESMECEGCGDWSHKSDLIEDANGYLICELCIKEDPDTFSSLKKDE